MAREPAPEERVSKVVCGLGNPGPQYDGTRHNVGFRVVEILARRGDARLADGVCRSKTARVEELEDVLLVAPQTYMNRSGYALRCLAERFDLQPESILVVYDDVHLPLGRLRLRGQGSPAGHRGMESILENLGTDQVPRLRLGIGQADGPAPGDDLVELVLGRFDADEQEIVDEMVRRAADACELWTRLGVEAAMQEFNG